MLSTEEDGMLLHVYDKRPMKHMIQGVILRIILPL